MKKTSAALVAALLAAPTLAQAQDLFAPSFTPMPGYYVGIGGVYATASKDNPEPPIGADGLRTLVDAIHARAPAMPIAAIAGIDETNAAEVIAAGADGIAVIAALARAKNPAAAARRLRGIVDRGLRARAGL